MFCRTVFGRNCLGLLASLILAPQYSPCQTDRAEPNPRVVQNFVSQPDVAPLPTRDQIPIRPPISSPITINFPAISRAAGLIFSGTVTRVERRPAGGQAIETVAITFHVENAIRGATPGEDFTISQWIGLWSGGQRYRVGERVLLFLYPPSKLGLTSCVAGAWGASASIRGAVSCFPRNIFQRFEQIPSWVGSRAYVSAISPWRCGGPVRRNESQTKR